MRLCKLCDGRCALLRTVYHKEHRKEMNLLRMMSTFVCYPAFLGAGSCGNAFFTSHFAAALLSQRYLFVRLLGLSSRLDAAGVTVVRSMILCLLWVAWMTWSRS